MDIGSPESVAIAATFGVEPLRFRWTDNSAIFPPFYSGIYDGGYALAGFINSLQLSAQDNLDVVAHSHGGNVVKIASYFIAHPIRHLINLGTPINYDLPLLASNAAFHYCQVSSYTDYVQFSGSSPVQVGFYAYFEYEVGYYTYLATSALFDDNWDDFWYYSALAASYQAIADSWWLSTKLALDGANNIMFYDGQSHADLHEPPVWNAIKSSCALN